MEKRTLIEEFHLSLYATKGKLADSEINRAVRHVRSARFRRKLERHLREFIDESSSLKQLLVVVSW
jgi:hypothetical protein